MNSQSEKKSFDSLVDALVEKNSQSMAEIELKPYTPMVYAIPGPMWESMIELLKTACTFQPTLYRKLEPLATRDELQEYVEEIRELEGQYMQTTVDHLTSVQDENLNQIRKLLRLEQTARENFQKQVGNAQEEFTFKVSKDFSAWKKELEAFGQETERRWRSLRRRITLGLVLSWALAFGMLWMLLH